MLGDDSQSLLYHMTAFFFPILCPWIDFKSTKLSELVTLLKMGLCFLALCGSWGLHV